jgi:Ion channel
VKASHENVAILWPLVVGMGITLVTIVIHALAMRTMIEFVRYERRRGHTGISFWRDLGIIAGAILWTFAAHVVEIAAWGIAFYYCGEFTNFAAAFYHSAENYTTLGYGDLVMSASWRLLGPFEAADGMLMFGVSTAMIFAVIQRLVEVRLPNFDS